jgi:hypothetical protein
MEEVPNRRVDADLLSQIFFSVVGAGKGFQRLVRVLTLLEHLQSTPILNNTRQAWGASGQKHTHDNGNKHNGNGNKHNGNGNPLAKYNLSIFKEAENSEANHKIETHIAEDGEHENNQQHTSNRVDNSNNNTHARKKPGLPANNNSTCDTNVLPPDEEILVVTNLLTARHVREFVEHFKTPAQCTMGNILEALEKKGDFSAVLKPRYDC